MLADYEGKEAPSSHKRQHPKNTDSGVAAQPLSCADDIIYH